GDGPGRLPRLAARLRLRRTAFGGRMVCGPADQAAPDRQLERRRGGVGLELEALAHGRRGADEDDALLAAPLDRELHRVAVLELRGRDAVLVTSRDGGAVQGLDDVAGDEAG